MALFRYSAFRLVLEPIPSNTAVVSVLVLVPLSTAVLSSVSHVVLQRPDCSSLHKKLTLLERPYEVVVSTTINSSCRFNLLMKDNILTTTSVREVESFV